jgi:hypothetical protein
LALQWKVDNVVSFDMKGPYFVIAFSSGLCEIRKTFDDHEIVGTLKIDIPKNMRLKEAFISPNGPLVIFILESITLAKFEIRDGPFTLGRDAMNHLSEGLSLALWNRRPFWDYIRYVAGHCGAEQVNFILKRLFFHHSLRPFDFNDFLVIIMSMSRAANHCKNAYVLLQIKFLFEAFVSCLDEKSDLDCVLGKLHLFRRMPAYKSYL